MNNHFLQDAPLAENDVVTKHLVTEPKMLLQNADVFLILPNRIVELKMPVAEIMIKSISVVVLSLLGQ
jgi:hypothetical protein